MTMTTWKYRNPTLGLYRMRRRGVASSTLEKAAVRVVDSLVMVTRWLGKQCNAVVAGNGHTSFALKISLNSLYAKRMERGPAPLAGAL
jgi:hypothetical protein